MGSARRFKQIDVPRQGGEMARIKILRGPDRGALYVIFSNQANIGRGEESDVMLSDLKTSRLHAKLSLGNRGWVITDLGSANGISHNEKAVRNATLKTGDTVSLGETTFEFLQSDVPTQILTAPPKSPEQLRQEQIAFRAQQDRVRALGKIGGTPPWAQLPRQEGSGQGLLKNPWVALLLAGGVALLFLGGGDEVKSPKKPKKTEEPSRDLASYLPKETAKEANQAAETFLKTGFREYRERNYLRAKVQFETVLQMMPGHPLATLYLSNCEKAIQEEVKAHLDRGRKDQTTGRLKAARGHFEAVMRLLYRDQSNPSYLEAKDQLEKVNQLRSKEAGSG